MFNADHSGAEKSNVNAAVSLDEVIARGTSVHWDEAVATVEELCDVAIAASGDEAPVPALADVLIGSHGDVTLRRSRGENSPTAAGRMLHALLANADVPMPLRLFVTQSTAPETHRSLREFAAALAYFGKPARARLIQDVYVRCMELGRLGRPVAHPVPVPVPVRETESSKESRNSQHSKRRVFMRRAVMVASLCLAIGAAWIWMNRATRTPVEGAAARVLSNAATMIADLGQQVREVLRPAAAPSAPLPAEPPTPRSRAKGKSGATPLAVAAAPTPLVGRRVTTTTSGVLELATAIPSVAVPPSGGASTEASAIATHTPAAPIYSNADSDVDPPVLLLPQLVPPPVGAGSAAGVNRMVVVVSPDGTVERVQLVDAPSRMPDMMLLSGAKTWKFAPAVKDGEPVRYRTVITWSGLP